MKAHISIGIAAYNEEGNIAALLDALLVQKTSAPISEVLVVSDASSDRTDEIVHSYEGRSPVRLIRLTSRSGQNQAQNRLHSEAVGEVLVVLDADILPSGNRFIEDMVAPILSLEAELVGVPLMPLIPNSFFGNMLAEMHLGKARAYEQWKQGKNIYRCFGPARAFSKRLYHALRYPDNCPTDAYSYLYATQEGYAFTVASGSPALFQVPANFADHMRQSNRFSNGKKTLERLFPVPLVRNEFALPLTLLIPTLCRDLIRHPLYTTAFILITLCVRLCARGRVFTSRWDPPVSTKTLLHPPV